MKSPTVIGVLRAIVAEVRERDGDIIDAENAEPDYHLSITLTVAEVRVIRDFLESRPSR